MKREALKLVEDLNRETFLDGVSLEFYDPFEFRDNGTMCSIYFMGILVWIDEADMREYITDNERESLWQYVVRESKKILSDLHMRMAQVDH